MALRICIIASLHHCIIASLHGPQSPIPARFFRQLRESPTSHWSVKQGGPVNRPCLGPGTVLIRLWICPYNICNWRRWCHQVAHVNDDGNSLEIIRSAHWSVYLYISMIPQNQRRMLGMPEVLSLTHWALSTPRPPYFTYLTPWRHYQRGV